MSDVFIQICDAKEQLENPALLREIMLRSDFGERRESDVCIGEQPVERRAIHRFAALAAVESEIGARERLIEKVIEAQGLGGERRRHLFFASIHAAASGGSCRHDTPFGPAIPSSGAEANLSHFGAHSDGVVRVRRFYYETVTLWLPSSFGARSVNSNRAGTGMQLDERAATIYFSAKLVRIDGAGQSDFAVAVNRA